MAEDSLCPKCGGVVPGHAPQGLCPACLMAFALGEEPAEPSSEHPPEPTLTYSPDLDRDGLLSGVLIDPRVVRPKWYARLMEGHFPHVSHVPSPLELRRRTAMPPDDPELARRIDQLCREFEENWREPDQPSIEDLLERVDVDGREALLIELIALERELFAGQDKVASREDYLGRFPLLTFAVDRGFEASVGVAPISPMGISEAPTIGPAEHADIQDTEAVTMPPRRGSGPDETLDLDPDAARTRIESDRTADFREPGRPTDPGLGTIRYFGDYELISEIARGGMAVVYRARQLSLNRPVALKMILAGQLAGEDDIRRFHIEAEAAANLDHPGIVPIYEIGEHDGQHFFSMGFVEGTSLAVKVADGPLPPREAASLTMQVAEAMHYAHDRGVIHRDFKPGNVLLDSQGRPKVTDFGLAKKLQSDSGLTQTGQVMGTPSYMPPEQAEGKEVGPPADVYALGAVLYCLLTGRPPFQAAPPMDTLIQVMEKEPVPPRQLNPSVPRDLETICLRCLEKGPGKRYASAEALANDLDRYLSGEPIVARPVTRSERAVKWARRKPAIAALMGLVAIVAALGLGGVMWQWRAAVRARNVADKESQNAKVQANLAEGRRVEAEVRRQEAEQARAKEKEQTTLAERRLQDTLKAQAEEKKQTELAQQRLYDVRMNLVQHYWEDFNGELLQQGLYEQLSSNQRGIDRRGFEWFYWQRKMSSGHITLKGHTGPVKSVAFSPDGKRLASASDDHAVKVWDAGTGKETLALNGHTQWVYSVAFSPDGKRLASASYDRTLKVWDAATGQETLTLKGHTSAVWSVVFSPDGRRLASASSDQTVKMWDVATGQETLTLKGHKGGLSPESVAYGPDGKRLALASFDGTVSVWDAATGQETLTLKGHTSQVNGVAFSPDGRRLASASADGTVKVWDGATGQETLTLKAHTSQVNGVAFSPDGKRLASASGDRTVMVWDVGTGQEPFTLKGHTVAFSRDGKRVASANADRTVKVWDVGTGQETLTLKGHTGGAGSVAFSPDGKRLASASEDKTVNVWDTVSGQGILTVKGHTASVGSVAFRPDGSRLASASNDKTVKVWDAATGQEILTVKGHTKEAWSVAYSPDGRRLASASSDQTVKVWDAVSGHEILRLKGHTASLWSVAFSPDGKGIQTSKISPVETIDQRIRFRSVEAVRDQASQDNRLKTTVVCA
jgi:eukaryotic-like serine/threonine-protein kinase